MTRPAMTATLRDPIWGRRIVGAFMSQREIDALIEAHEAITEVGENSALPAGDELDRLVAAMHGAGHSRRSHETGNPRVPDSDLYDEPFAFAHRISRDDHLALDMCFGESFTDRTMTIEVRWHENRPIYSVALDVDAVDRPIIAHRAWRIAGEGSTIAEAIARAWTVVSR